MKCFKLHDLRLNVQLILLPSSPRDYINTQTGPRDPIWRCQHASNERFTGKQYGPEGDLRKLK